VGPVPDFLGILRVVYVDYVVSPNPCRVLKAVVDPQHSGSAVGYTGEVGQRLEI